MRDGKLGLFFGGNNLSRFIGGKNFSALARQIVLFDRFHAGYQFHFFFADTVGHEQLSRKQMRRFWFAKEEESIVLRKLKCFQNDKPEI